jgi:hypothetical protein
MEKAVLQQVSEIRKRMKCCKAFQCAESGFKRLCQAKDVGLRRHLLCLEIGAASCDFSLFVEKKYYCACPLRVYLIRNLQIEKMYITETV